MVNPEIDEYGTQTWYNEQGLYHREDGPAIELSDGRAAWYNNGKLHREDGPAIEWNDGDKSWYLNDIEYSKEEYKFMKGVNINV